MNTEFWLCFFGFFVCLIGLLHCLATLFIGVEIIAAIRKLKQKPDDQEPDA